MTLVHDRALALGLALATVPTLATSTRLRRRRGRPGSAERGFFGQDRNPAGPAHSELGPSSYVWKQKFSVLEF